MKEGRIIVRFVQPLNYIIAEQISKETDLSAVAGPCISKGSIDLIIEKIATGNVAVSDCGSWAGFPYLGALEEGKFVSNSGLIISAVL